MIAGNKESTAFRDYFKGLYTLEKAFRVSGENIEFHLKLHNGKDRYVEIFHDGKLAGLKFIEGDSPAQGIKHVAGAVPS
jgi:hypothetical protein